MGAAAKACSIILASHGRLVTAASTGKTDINDSKRNEENCYAYAKCPVQHVSIYKASVEQKSTVTVFVWTTTIDIIAEGYVYEAEYQFGLRISNVAFIQASAYFWK